MDQISHWGTGEPDPEFWVNLRTGEVEQGRQSPAADRMGPYPTREAAQHASDTAEQRNVAWDEEDRCWNDDRWPRESGPAAP